MIVKSIDVHDYSTGKNYYYSDKSGNAASIRSEGGKINVGPGNTTPGDPEKEKPKTTTTSATPSSTSGSNNNNNNANGKGTSTTGGGAEPTDISPDNGGGTNKSPSNNNQDEDIRNGAIGSSSPVLLSSLLAIVGIVGAGMAL